MLHFFVGTKAQMIKLAPIMQVCRQRGIAYRYIDSGQHAETTRALALEFGLPAADVSLSGRDRDVTSILSALAWFTRQTLRCFSRSSALQKRLFLGGGVCIVHGDTLSTLLGCHLAKAAGIEVAHIEAGLYSGRRFEPFPEEWIRGHCTRRSDVLFAPSAEAEAHLLASGNRGQPIHMVGNTVRDALRSALIQKPPVDLDVPPQFALVTCHRAETIFIRWRLRRVIELVNRIADRMPVVFVMHRPTLRQLRRFKLEHVLAASVRRIEVMGHARFVSYVGAASFVITDGGSIQEECALLGKRCLVIRSVTERSDGLDAGTRLWNFDNVSLDDWLNQSETHAPKPTPAESPSERIIDILMERYV